MTSDWAYFIARAWRLSESGDVFIFMTQQILYNVTLHCCIIMLAHLDDGSWKSASMEALQALLGMLYGQQAPFGIAANLEWKVSMSMAL